MRSLPVLCMVALPLLALVHPPTAHAATVRVPADEPTIQQGINAAAYGDTVLVAPGTYTGPTNRNLEFHGVDRVLRSEAGPAQTIIDCQRVGRGFYFHKAETAASVVDGFTIRNAFTGNLGGAGILCDAASPNLRQCVLTENDAVTGAGVLCTTAASPLIQDCTFSRNIGFGGAAIYCMNASPRVIDCDFVENEVSHQGGAMYCGPLSKPVISGCSFLGTRRRTAVELHARNPLRPSKIANSPRTRRTTTCS